MNISELQVGTSDAFKVRHALLPDTALTPAQLELARAHGTPLAFSEACADALGEISWDEAEEAVREYLDHWCVAGKLPA